MEEYLQPTKMLDYQSIAIQRLIEHKKWKEKAAFDQILGIYNFVRDEIRFGFNVDDTISATSVLEDGYGQCNTKGTLLMALLRAVGIPCRLHGFTIDKALQKGAMKGFIYRLAPSEILHSWVEVYFEEKWFNLEGFILDVPYLLKLQRKFSDCTGNFCGYGVATDQFKHPPIKWEKNNTYIQSKGIRQDFGVFASPDEFFNIHQQKLSPLKKYFYQQFARKFMNKNISAIRKM